MYKGKSTDMMAIKEDAAEEDLSSVRYKPEEIQVIKAAEQSPFVNHVIPVNEVIENFQEK